MSQTVNLQSKGPLGTKSESTITCQPELMGGKTLQELRRYHDGRFYSREAAKQERRDDKVAQTQNGQ
jgi:hypothetical protein